jgi:hypothetical protein
MLSRKLSRVRSSHTRRTVLAKTAVSGMRMQMRIRVRVLVLRSPFERFILDANDGYRESESGGWQR